MRRIAITVAIIIGYLIYFGIAYSQISAQGGEGGKSNAGFSGQGGKGGDGTVIIGNNQGSPTVDNEKVNANEIKRLIKALDADDINVRDKATDELKNIGSPALMYLEESAKSDSPEVAWRSKVIINAINKNEQNKQPEPNDSATKKIGPTIKQFGNNFNIIIKGGTPGTKSFSMSQDGSGKISVTITEYGKDGKQNSKNYEAGSTEEFKQKYPEIASEYGIGEKPPTTPNIPGFDFDDIFKDFGKSWDKRMEDEISRLRDMFNRQGHQPPKALEPEDEDVLPGQSSALSETDLGLSLELVEESTLKDGMKDKGGVLVTGVKPLGLGEKMGLKQGDVIININNVVIKSAWECRRLLKTAIGNGRVSLTVISNNNNKEVRYPR